MSRKNLLAVVAVAVLLIAAAGLTAQSPDAIYQQVRANQGLKMAPVPLALEGKDPSLIGYGSYLVNAVGGCNDCHTNPTYATGGDPFKGEKMVVNAAGYLGGGQSFGPFTSRNLTPEVDKFNRPAGMTFDEFLMTMRTGVDHDNLHPQMGPLLQVMPWPAYAQMTDYDLRAIYEYLRCIPPVKVAPPPATPAP
ncbi:cytochrome C [Paludibaculum fermentans]|uniref:cytochrome C n=1 Tax=Paludibaculum fermentans TaxID=1473598 RepID=UPI003EC00778